MTIYLSGPMSMYGAEQQWGKAIFDAYAKRYRAQGFTVISPLEHDLEILGGRPFQPGDYGQCLAADVKLLGSGKVDRIYMLPGWQQSRGARLERLAAQTVGIPAFDAVTGAALATQVIVTEVPNSNTMADAIAREDS